MYIPKRTESMFIAALYVIAKKWKQLKYSSAYERINKMWHIHTMQHYVAIKKNEVLIHVTTWMNLEKMLNERIQSQKITYCMITLI